MGGFELSVLELIESARSLESHAVLRKAFSGSSVTVTGGASFIGSHLVDALLEMDASVTVIDDFSSGKRSNLTPQPGLTITEGDLRDREFTNSAVPECDVVFHLAAIHGGRGFIESQQQAMLSNLSIDNNLFSAATKARAGTVVHASSACAYPIGLQAREDVLLLLSEDQASMEMPEKSFPDGVYGWIKLIGEYQLENMIRGTATKGRAARIFTAYGERENESHAAMALIAKALLKMDPYPVWGNGQQTRNFTYVADTVYGLLLLGADRSSAEFDVFNVGTSDHVRVIDFVRAIFNQLGWEPAEIDFQLDRPVGVASRASENTKMSARFGWSPSVSVEQGIGRTLTWYAAQPDRPRSVDALELLLLAR